MKLTAIKRFNFHDPGEVFDASEENGKKWVKEGLARQYDKTTDETGIKPTKEAMKPPADKTAKGAKTK